MVIIWSDGIESRFSLIDLEKNFTKKTVDVPFPSKLWTSKNFPECRVDYNTFLSTPEGLKKALENLCIHGYTIVSESPKNTKMGTKTVAERIGPIFQNTYGNTWELTAIQEQNVSDTSYTNVRLEPHTDATYLNPATG